MSSNNNNTAPNSAALSRDIGRADSTIEQDKSAINLLNHFLVQILNMNEIDDIDIEELNEECENILMGYSHYLRNTNIPLYHKRFLKNPELIPTQFMTHSGLMNYLSKAINLFRKLLGTRNEFLNNEEAVQDISGVKFARACKRSQQGKDSTFGIESKIGLYRVARLGASGCPHWINLYNCDDICKNMLKETKNGDTASRLTEKRLTLVTTKHAVGRAGEASGLDIKHMHFNPFFSHLDAVWVDKKNIKSYACPFVPNKDGYGTDVFHALGCYFVLGRGLYRTPGEDNKLSTRLMPYLTECMAACNVSRFLTNAIRKYLSDEIPPQEKLSVSATSLRVAGVTEMGAGNVGFYASHARSGHDIGTKQENYYDASDIATSLPAAKCLAGWTDFYGRVFLPTFASTGASQATIDQLLSQLLVVTVPEFQPEGRLRPVLLACIASMLMYDGDVSADLGPSNAITQTLKAAFKRANIIDPRTGLPGPGSSVATMKLWGDEIKEAFQRSNPDFQPLTNESNSVQVVNALNHMGTATASVNRAFATLKTEYARCVAAEESLRSEMMRMREDHARERLEDRAFQVALLAKVERLSKWQRVPLSPERPSSSSSSPASGRKRPIGEENRAVAAPAEATTLRTATVPTAAPLAAAPPPVASAPPPVIALPPPPPPPPVAAVSVSNIASTSAASSDTHAMQMERNYYDTDADGTNGGTTIDDIILSAYAAGSFKSAVKFPGIKIPGRFNDKAKYNHCLDLFGVVATEEDCVTLARDNLNLEEVINVSRSIGDACLKHLEDLEGATKPHAKKGYTGVGTRVQKVKSKWPQLVRTDARQTSILEYQNR